jgi:hypothetical protein
MTFVWYYPKTNGVSVCLENFDPKVYTQILQDLNKYLFMNNVLTSK